MITWTKNKYGDITSVIEWFPVNEKGIWQDKDADYIFIGDFYICPSYRGHIKKFLEKLVPKVRASVPTATKVYWERYDKKNVKTRKSIILFSVRRFDRYGKRTISSTSTT